MPTIKQKKAFKEMVANGSTMKDALVNAGYSEKTARAPTKVTKSDGWKELLEKHLPDKDLTAKHKQLLNSDREEIAIKALDLGYKVKAKFPKELNENPLDGDLKVLLVQINNVITGQK